MKRWSATCCYSRARRRSRSGMNSCQASKDPIGSPWSVFGGRGLQREGQAVRGCRGRRNEPSARPRACAERDITFCRGSKLGYLSLLVACEKPRRLQPDFRSDGCSEVSRMAHPQSGKLWSFGEWAEVRPPTSPIPDCVGAGNLHGRRQSLSSVTR